MEAVNTLKVRNHLGEILDRQNSKGESILIGKGLNSRAAFVTPEQFGIRFVVWQIFEEFI